MRQRKICSIRMLEDGHVRKAAQSNTTQSRPAMHLNSVPSFLPPRAVSLLSGHPQQRPRSAQHTAARPPSLLHSPGPRPAPTSPQRPPVHSPQAQSYCPHQHTTDPTVILPRAAPSGNSNSANANAANLSFQIDNHARYTLNRQNPHFKRSHPPDSFRQDGYPAPPKVRGRRSSYEARSVRRVARAATDVTAFASHARTHTTHATRVMKFA